MTDDLFREIADAVDRFEGNSSGPTDAVALAPLRDAFGLSRFELDVIALCAGYVLDPKVATRLGGPPTLALAFAKLSDGHLDATAADAPLFLHRLVHASEGAHKLGAPLSIDERVLQFLLGIRSLDERLLPYADLIDDVSVSLADCHVELAGRIARAITRTATPAVIQIHAGDAATRLAIAHAAASANNLRALRLRASALGVPPLELGILKRICVRESRLASILVVVDVDPFDGNDAMRWARAFCDGMPGGLVITAPDPIPLARVSVASFEIPEATTEERRRLWTRALDGHALCAAPELERVSHQFRLGPQQIRDVAAGLDPEATPVQLWDACITRSRARVEDLARRVEPTATWDDLVVSTNARTQLREIVSQLRHRYRVHDHWQLARGESRGQAITALFSGPSGVGKTLSAEVIARELRLDLYHVDLSQVVDKYIGETEKRLRRIFDDAEAGGSILLFDEADALFGKRAEVERGTDRWANLEVSYLLQRMERYRGLAILTTNAKHAIDTAFLRRLRFVVPFTYPDADLRAELWRRAFPAAAPVGALEPAKLARLQLTGANIKNIALRAAFHAAEGDTDVTMTHIVRAARSEFAKLEQPFPEAEVHGWGVRG